MGKGTEAKTERNTKLIQCYLAENEDGTRKLTIIDLINEFEITPKRIYEILKANNVPSKWRVAKVEKPQKKKAKQPK